jgi:hypothetical protein
MTASVNMDDELDFDHGVIGKIRWVGTLRGDPIGENNASTSETRVRPAHRSRCSGQAIPDASPHPPTVLPASRMWTSRRAFVLDQGQTPHCVGFAWAGFLEAAPHMHQLTNADGDRFYSLAQQNDEWEGENYDGTSTRGGAKALQSLGLIEGEYVWAQTEDDVWKFVLTRGPVVAGTTWLTGFMATDSKGYLNLTGGRRVDTTGSSSEPATPDKRTGCRTPGVRAGERRAEPGCAGRTSRRYWNRWAAIAAPRLR